jgi:heterotetrameric sarcosine oxidase gamma subunit
MSTLERRCALDAYWQRAATNASTLAPGATALVMLWQRRPLSILQVSSFSTTTQDAGKRLAEALKLALPSANRCHGDVRLSLRSVSPGSWQLVGEPEAVPLAADLRQRLAGAATVVDLGHARAAFYLVGEAAADTLHKHCGVDLDGARFPSGSSIATRFGAIGVNLTRLNAEPGFELLVPRSCAEHALELLLGAGVEFGLKTRSCT